MLKASLRDSRARPVEDLFLDAKQVMFSSAVRPNILWSSPDLTPLTGLSDLGGTLLLLPAQFRLSLFPLFLLLQDGSQVTNISLSAAPT